MARYVDGFVIPIAKKDLNAYRRLARAGARIWKKHGAVAYAECSGEDLKNQWGGTFTKLCRLKRGETVVFSWVVYKSKADRKKVNAAVMKDPAMQKMMVKAMPFDTKRMAYGGFNIIVDF